MDYNMDSTDALVDALINFLTHDEKIAGLHDAEIQESSERADDLPVASIAGYSILRNIGKGGFGKVLLARDESTTELCAIKVVRLDDDGAVDWEGMKRAQCCLDDADPRTAELFVNVRSIVGGQDGAGPFICYVLELADFANGQPENPKDEPKTLAWHIG